MNKPFFTFVTLLMTAPVFAQTIPTPKEPVAQTAQNLILPTREFSLGLSEAFIKADSQNPQLVAARKNLDISQGDITIAGAVPNPQISAQYSLGSIASEQGNPQQLGFSQTFELGGKRDARLALAGSQYQLTTLQLNALRWDVRSRVRRAYAELAAAEATAQFVDALIGLADRLVDIASKRFEAGASPKAEVLQAQLTRSQLDTQKTQASGRILSAKTQLNSLIGEKPEQPAEVEDKGLFNLSVTKTELVPVPTVVLPTADDLVTQAYDQRLDLRATLQQIEVAQNQLRLAQALRTPDLQAGLAYAFTTFGNSTPQASGLVASMGLTLPIFYNQVGEVAKAQAIIDQSGLQVTALKQLIATNVRVSYQTLSVARENIRKYQTQLLPASTQVLQLAQESYQVGKTGLSSVILAQQANQQIRSGYLDAIVAYQAAWADLELAVGAPLSLS